jgi:hypothetical protein
MYTLQPACWVELWPTTERVDGPSWSERPRQGKVGVSSGNVEDCLQRRLSGCNGLAVAGISVKVRKGHAGYGVPIWSASGCSARETWRGSSPSSLGRSLALPWKGTNAGPRTSRGTIGLHDRPARTVGLVPVSPIRRRTSLNTETAELADHRISGGPSA